ncbi:MAG: J domain-containing protein [Rhodospirillales bacterium]|nr:J domain-containing protein [Rhodospirillales bacterium]
MAAENKKQSYTIPCSSTFRDAITRAAERRRVNVADLARSALLLVPMETIRKYPDPGEPNRDDRETIILKSGVSKGRPWRRKPRLQVRLTEGMEVATVRKALGIVLAIDEKKLRLGVSDGKARSREIPEIPPETLEELERLRMVVSVLSFDPLPGGIRSRDDALHVLGFRPGSMPDQRALRTRFRMLATIHHPDGEYGSHGRMSQINAAMAILRSGTY